VSDIFKYIKSRVNIVDFIEFSTQSKVEKVGSDTYRANPCPLCGHHDCDVITFWRLYKSLPDNLEAAKSIAEKMGISLDMMSNDTPIGTTKEEHHQSKDRAKEEANSDKEKANEIRLIVADFYHRQLFDDQKALDYQVKKRGHSIEILKGFKIGYAGRKSLIAALQNEGYAVEDLIAIGLVKKWRKEYRAVIPEGSFIYPHRLNGKVLYFTIKTPPEGNIFQIKKSYAGRGWFCFNQDALNSEGPLIVSEGENDLLSLVDKSKKPVAICTVGNFNTPQILSYLKDHAASRTFYLCFDREARVIKIPSPYKDIDDFLRAAENPQGDFKKLMKAAEVVEKNPPVEVAQSDHGNQTGYELLLIFFDSFQVLGELSDNRLAFWSKVKRKIYIFALKELTLDALIQIGDEQVRWRVFRTKDEIKGAEGKIHFNALKKEIILEAGKNLLGEEKWLGQGINLLEDGRLLIVSGDESVIWDGKDFETFELPMIEKKFIRRNPGESWINLKMMQAQVLKMDKEEARKICTNAMQLIRKWGFASDYDVLLITGFLFSQMLQSVWHWRPHMWISGPQGSGKTLLIEFFNRIAGHLARCYEGQILTEAGFRQDLQSDFRVILIDELEKSFARKEILDLLRSAGRGGLAAKGTVSGRAVHYSIKHMVLLASIEHGLDRAAEKHRFIIVEMNKDPRRNPIIPSLEEAEQLRIDFFSFAVWGSLKAKKMIGDFILELRNDSNAGNYEPRLIEAYSVPIAMATIADPEPFKNLKEFTLEVLEIQQELGEDISEDEDSLLENILTSIIQFPVDDQGKATYSKRSISQLLEDQSEFVDKNLQAYGIKSTQEGLFLVPQVIERMLLQDTMWKGFNIRSILKRLPGAVNVQKWIAGKRLRGLLLTKWGEKTDEEQ